MTKRIIPRGANSLYATTARIIGRIISDRQDIHMLAICSVDIHVYVLYRINNTLQYHNTCHSMWQAMFENRRACSLIYHTFRNTICIVIDIGDVCYVLPILGASFPSRHKQQTTSCRLSSTTCCTALIHMCYIALKIRCNITTYVTPCGRLCLKTDVHAVWLTKRHKRWMHPPPPILSLILNHEYLIFDKNGVAFGYVQYKYMLIA